MNCLLQRNGQGEEFLRPKFYERIVNSLVNNQLSKKYLLLQS